MGGAGGCDSVSAGDYVVSSSLLFLKKKIERGREGEINDLQFMNPILNYTQLYMCVCAFCMSLCVFVCVCGVCV